MSPVEASNLIPRASLSDVVYQRLRDELMEGQIAGGSRLSQVQLAERYGVSRIPVREALRRLQAESLVEAAPYHTFIVCQITPEQVLELVDIRLALEDLAIARREPPTSEEISELKTINQQMVKVRRKGMAWFELDRSFHAVIAGPASLTNEMLTDVRDRLQKYLRMGSVLGEAGRSDAAPEHAAIIEAFEARDMERAREFMRLHVLQSRMFLESRMLADH